MSTDTVVEVNRLSKKFCRNLKRSLWYGVTDIAGELLLRSGNRSDLRRDEFWALQDISFEIARGEMLGMIGHNGAGKSTLLKLLHGLIVPDQGSISIKGNVAALIELGTGFNPVLTGKENIYVNAAVLGISKKQVDQNLQNIIDFAEIGDFIDAPVQSYSSGMKVRLGFSIASHLNPNLLLLDEVLSVGDSSFRARCYRRLENFRESGGSAVFVSHNTNAIEATCDRVMLLDRGRIVTIGKPSEIVQQFEELMIIKSREADQRISGEGNGNEGGLTDLPIEILGVDLCGSSREEKSTYEFGEPMELRITYRTNRVVTSPYFDVVFRKSDYGSAVLSRMSMMWDGTELTELNGSGVVRCVIKNPELTPGNYTVDVGVQSKPTAQMGQKWYQPSQTRGGFSILPGKLKSRLPGTPGTQIVSMPPIVLDYRWEIDVEPNEPFDPLTKGLVKSEHRVSGN